MSDIALKWQPTVGAADFSVAANDLVVDDGLETAVRMSLFLDRRAEDSDVLPDGQTSRRGWWGDAFPQIDGDKIGSRLWLLAREKSTSAVAARAEEYAREALAWLVEDQIADSVDVESEIVQTGILALSVAIQRPGADPVRFRYQYSWAAQQAQGA